MPGVDVAAATIAVPIWAAGAASAVLLAALILAIGRAGGAALIAALFRLAIVALVVYAGWIYLQRLASQDRVAEQRGIDDRAATLMARAIAPGSALSCLDELAGETVESACEQAVFASPEAVAAAVSYVTAKLALLGDAARLAERGQAASTVDLGPLRAALELDRFGIVAHVLSRRDGCTAEQCDGLTQLQDSSRVLANLREHPFEERVTQYSSGWKVATRPATVGEAAASGSAVVAAAPQPSASPTPSPTTVAPKYDFPSAQSIPPVSIMAPEPPPRQTSAATDAPPAAPPLAAASASGQAVVTPMPPRRPPQARAAAASRPAATHEPQPAPNPSGDAANDASSNRAPPQAR